MNTKLLINIFREWIYNEHGLFLYTFNHNCIAASKDYEKSFHIKIQSDKSSYNIDFIPGNKSGLFFRSNGVFFKNNIDKINNLTKNINDVDETKINFLINNYLVNDLSKTDEIDSIGVEIKFYHPNYKQDELIEHFSKVSSYFSDIIFLMIKTQKNKNSTDLNNTEVDGYPEGAITQITVNKYERSSYNRKICLEKYGHTCKACNFNFSDVYGEIGQDFIHVHHIVPASKIKSDNYNFDPIKDLIPLCPNCHAMAHKKLPDPYTLEELKEILKKNNNA